MPSDSKRYIMIGAPVTTVRTPPMLESYLRESGVAARVDVRHVDAEDLAAFMDEIRDDLSIDGLMVTMPHKQALLPRLSAVSSVASRAGGVNAAKRLASGELVGAQFDGVALVGAVTKAGAALTESTVLLAGVGGAGLAIAQALAAHGCRKLAIAENNGARLDAALADLCAHGFTDAAAFAPDGDQRFDVLVNATPLGMRPGDPSPFAEDLVAGARFVADIVADPPQTRLAALTRAAGRKLVTGRDMVGSQIAPIGDWLLSPQTEQTPV